MLKNQFLYNPISESSDYQSCIRQLLPVRQPNGEYSALAQPGIYRDGPAVFFDKFAGDHQAESGAAMAFGTEKRSK